MNTVETNESIDQALIADEGRKFGNFMELVREVQRQQLSYSKEDLVLGITAVTADLIAACKQYVAVYGAVDEGDATLIDKICSTLLSEYDYQNWGDEKIEDE